MQYMYQDFTDLILINFDMKFSEVCMIKSVSTISFFVLIKRMV